MSDSPLPSLPVSAEMQAAIQAARDADHLRLLEISFYISGIVTALRFLWFVVVAGFFAVAGLGTAFAAHIPSTASGSAPPALLFFIIAGVFGAIILLTLVFAALEIYAGYCLKERRNPLVIQIVAAFFCISIPWGTAVGIFTFMVLSRPSVKVLFNKSA